MSTWKELIEKTGIENLSIVSENNKNAEFFGYQLLLPGMKAENADYLYLVSEKDLKQIKFEADSSFVVLNNGKTSREWDMLKKNLPMTGNCLRVKKEKANKTVLEDINGFFAARYDIALALHKMQHCVKNNCGMQALADIVSELFELPVDILDNSFRFVVTSSDHGLKSEYRDLYAHPGESLPIETLEQLNQEGVLKQIMGAHEPICVQTYFASAWFVPIEVENIKAGYMVLFNNPKKEGGGIKSEYKVFLKDIATFICFELGKHKYFGPNKASHFNYTLLSILKSTETKKSEIKKKLALYDYKLEEDIYLIQVEKDETTTESWEARGMVSFLHIMFPNSIYTIIENKLFFLLSRSAEHKIETREFVEWNVYMEANNLWAGIVGPIRDFNDMPERLEQLKMLIRCARRKNDRHVLLFEENKIDAMLEKLFEKRDIEGFFYEPVVRLVEYDTKNKEKGELVQTLKEYLNHPKEISEICENLAIHKNTLYKRLDRIRQIMDNDFVSAEEIMKIQLTFHMMNI